MVACWLRTWPLALRTCRMRSLGIGATCGDPEHLLDRAAAHRRHVRGTAEPVKAVDDRLDQVVRVTAAQALGQDVLDSRHLEHRPHRGAGDDAGAGGGRLEQHLARAEVADDLVWNRPAARDRDCEHALLRRLARLADRLRDLVRLAQPDADPALLIAHRDDGVEREPPATLDHLGAAIDLDHALGELRPRSVRAARRRTVTHRTTLTSHLEPPRIPDRRRARR